jgi:Winged helix-turn helix
MPVPIARPVSLPSEEPARLESLVRAHSTPQALALRCRLILRTAAPDRPSNRQVATEMACERHTVGRWRQRYLAHGLSGLQDASRSGRPRRLSPLCARGRAVDGDQETGHVSLSRPSVES